MTQIPDHEEDVGSGWLPILRKLHKDLLLLDPDYSILQVKEKWGGLRVYLDSEVSAVYACAWKAETESLRVCECCSMEGKPREIQGWWRTLCDDCAEDAWGANQ